MKSEEEHPLAIFDAGFSGEPKPKAPSHSSVVVEQDRTESASLTSVVALLNELWKGKIFTPAQYPSFAGTVAEVYEASDVDAGSWIVVRFESPESGVDGLYSIMDMTEGFTITEAERPSTSDVFNNSDRGTSSRNETESSSSISSTLAEIRERESDNYEGVSKGHAVNAALAALNDVRALLSIIDSLKDERSTLWSIARDVGADNIKAAILQRVREWGDFHLSQMAYQDRAGQAEAAKAHAIRSNAALEIATELEAVEITGEEKADGV